MAGHDYIYHPDKHHISVAWQDLHPENRGSDKFAAWYLHQIGTTPMWCTAWDAVWGIY